MTKKEKEEGKGYRINKGKRRENEKYKKIRK